MRLISKIGLALALTLSLGAVLSACGDDSAPYDLFFPVDYSVTHHDMAHAPGDAAQ